MKPLVVIASGHRALWAFRIELLSDTLNPKPQNPQSLTLSEHPNPNPGYEPRRCPPARCLKGLKIDPAEPDTMNGGRAHLHPEM